MAMIPLAMTAIATLASAFFKRNQPAETATPVPSVADPSVWPAGASASRRSRGASGLAQGDLWSTASRFTTAMPRLIAR